jgi:uncharacterized protein DUF3489
MGRRTTMEAVMSNTRSTTAKLSDSQYVILSAAAQRADGSLLPFPQRLTVKGAALNKVVETLCKRKLAEKRQASDGSVEWRRNEHGCPLGLFITTGGLLALGVDDAEKSALQQVAASISLPRKAAPARPRGKARKTPATSSKRRAAAGQTKQDLVIQMLRRQSGVRIEDIIAKTGWRPHSVRGFFSGLVRKKLKLPLISDVGRNGVRRYHIAPISSPKT